MIKYLKHQKRIQSLDFLRGVAVLLVMSEHFEVTDITTQIGWSGVDMFFVLSGFFIGGILFREYQKTGKINLSRFLVRRAFKIWPLFYTALFIHIIYYLIKEKTITDLASKIFNEVLFIQDYRVGIMGVSWSLGVEEKFYLFIVLSFVGVLKFTRKLSAVPFFA